MFIGWRNSPPLKKSNRISRGTCVPFLIAYQTGSVQTAFALNRRISHDSFFIFSHHAGAKKPMVSMPF